MAKFYVCFIVLFICIYVDARRRKKTNVCTLPKKVGPGRAAIPRYYYNSRSQLCEDFYWGGVQPNGNNFATKGECVNRCIRLCRLPKKTGRCRAAFRRYYYNRRTGYCQQFIYGGCGGNANNFRTLEACQEKCEPSRPRLTSGSY